MSTSKLTSMRVVQALAGQPRTAEEVAGLLRADEAAQNLTEATVLSELEEWEARGFVQRLQSPGDDDGPDLWLQRRVFANETERRLVAHLTVPRNVAGLVHELRADPNVATLTEEHAAGLLNGLEGKGLVVKLGDVDGDPRSAVDLAKAHADAITLPAEKADRHVARLSVPQRAWRAEGDQWVMSQKAHDALQVLA